MAQVVTLIKDFPNAKYSVVKWNEQYVACWLLETEDERIPGKEITCHWSQGHYFSKIEDALIYAYDRENEELKTYLEDVDLQLNRLIEAVTKLEERIK